MCDLCQFCMFVKFVQNRQFWVVLVVWVSDRIRHCFQGCRITVLKGFGSKSSNLMKMACFGNRFSSCEKLSKTVKFMFWIGMTLAYVDVGGLAKL